MRGSSEPTALGARRLRIQVNVLADVMMCACCLTGEYSKTPLDDNVDASASSDADDDDDGVSRVHLR